MLLPINDIYRFDEFELDPSSRGVSRHSELVPLSPRAFDLLIFLVLNPGRVITKEELLQGVWPDSFVEESNLAQYISAVRKALGDRASLIATIPGRGYQFTAKVQVVHPVDDLPESRPGDIYVQRVRERTHVRIEPPPPALALPSGTPSRRKAAIRWIGLSALAAALIALSSVLEWKRLAPRPQLRKVMVATFANSTGDPTFNNTLKRALEIDLEQSPYIDVMSEQEMLSTLQLMDRNDMESISPAVAKEVCERSNRQVLLTGDIAPIGKNYLLTLEATDCSSGKQLAAAKAQATTKEKVLSALDTIADRVRKGLGESAKSLENYRTPIISATTPSLEALKLYSIGQNMDAQGKSETDTLPFYQQAIERDPQFAMAYGAIATDYYNLGEMTLAAEYFKKAFELSDRTSARERLTLRAHYYADSLKDLRQGIDTYRQWTEMYPNDWVPWVDIANAYTQLGNYPLAITAGQKALAIEPNRPINYSVLVRAYKRANRFAEAKAVGAQAVQQKKDSVGLHASLYEIAVAEHDLNARSREVEWAADHNTGWYGVYFIYLQAEESATAGKYREAEDLFRRACAVAQQENLPEMADDILLDQAFIEFSAGFPSVARATLSRARHVDPDQPDFPILQAELGNFAPAERFLAAHATETHLGTLMEYVDLPRVRAALALRRGKPLEALQALDPASPYELADYDVLAEAATAYQQAGQPERARLEYRKILAHRGLDPVSILYPLAHLGMARAYAMDKNDVTSRIEYENFFDLWKDADANLPVLTQARIEYSHLK